MKHKNKQRKRPISLQRVVTISFIVDISDVVINLAVAYVSGSVTMFAQALEGATDLLSSGLLFIGVRLSKRPADHNHPYGYGREIYFWTFISGLAMFGITATLSFYWGFKRIIYPEVINNPLLTLIALSISIITNGYAFTLSYRRLMKGRPISQVLKVYTHSTLIETKTTFALDLMGTIASILGIIALVAYALSGNSTFDGIGAMATGAALAVFAVIILKGAMELLVGQAAPVEIEEKIRKIALSHKNVLDVLDIRTMQIGTEKLLVNIELHMKHGLRTKTIEESVDQIERKIKRVIPTAKHILIELDHPQ